MCVCMLVIKIFCGEGQGGVGALILSKSINFQSLPRLFNGCPSLPVSFSVSIADAFSRDFQFISNQALSNILPTGN